MSIAPNQIWSERFEQIGRSIEQGAEVLTQRWSERAREEQASAACSFHVDLRDRLPDFLRAMGRSLSVSATAVPAPHAMLALEHGEQRWEIGWQLADVIRDYQILRLVILEYLDELLEKPLETRESMAIGLALDEAVSASVQIYVGYQENRLREANRKLTEFLPVLGHELRNPLSAIVASMEILRMHEAGNDEIRETQEVIDRQLRHITRLLEDVSDVSRVLRGELELRRSPIDIRDVVQEAVESVHSRVTERDQLLTVALGDESFYVNGDEVRLLQVVMNLLTNAIKYTPPSGQIIVSVRRVGQFAAVHVRDNGVGIPRTMLPRVFEMFAQAPEHKHQGLGIGLALVRALVEMHDGRVTARSSGPNCGSEFIVELPLIADTQPRPTAAPPNRSAIDVPPLSILLAEDHQDSAQALAILLEDSGHVVRHVRDAAGAIAAVEHWNPDVILIDIGLPGTDGYQLARILRRVAQLRSTPMIAITGYAGEEVRQRAADASFDSCLAKPISLEALQQLLVTLVKR